METVMTGATIEQLAPYLEEFATWEQIAPYLDEFIRLQYVGIVLSGALLIWLCFFRRG